MIRAATRLVQAGCACLLLAQFASAAATIAPERGVSRALIVGVDDAGRGQEDSNDLARLLTSRLGFRSAVVASADSDAARVMNDMDLMFAASGSDDTVVVLLFLPISRPQAGSEAFLVAPGDSEADAYGIPLFMIGKMIDLGRFRQALIVTPDCSAQFPANRTLHETLMFSAKSVAGAFSAITLLSYCPQVTPGATSFADPGLAKSLYEILDKLPPGASIEVEELTERLARREEHARTRFQVEAIPPRSRSAFLFTARADMASSVAAMRLPSSKSVAEWQQAVTAIAATAQSSSANQSAVREPVELLRDIALNTVARHVVPPIARQQAVLELGKLPPAVVNEALSTIIRDSKDSLVRNAAIAQVAQLGSGTDLTAVRKAIFDRDPAVQQAAIRALAVREDPEAAGLIAQLLDGGGRLSTESKVVALQVLATYERPADAQRFARYFSDPSAEVRREAVAGIAGRLDPQDSGGVMRVIELLQADPDDGVREEAAYALGEIVPLEDISLVSIARSELIAAVQRGPDAVASAAVWSLGHFTSSAEIATLTCNLLRQVAASEELRAAAASALGRLRETSCLELLHALAEQSGPPVVRMAAIDALGALAQPQSIPALTAARDDPDVEIADLARNALQRIAGSGDVDQLLAALDDDSASFRAAAADRLAAFTDAETVGKLLAAFDSPSQRVRANALRAVRKNPDRRVTERILGRLGTEAGVAMRIELIRALPGRDFEQVGPALLGEAAKAYIPFRQAAAEALTVYALNSDVPNPQAARCLQILALDPSPAVRLPALEALSRPQSGTNAVATQRNRVLAVAEGSPSCRPVPLLGWKSAAATPYPDAAMQKVEIASAEVTSLAADERARPLKLNGGQYVEFNASGRFRATTGVSLRMTVSLDDVSDESILFSKFASTGSNDGSWFLAVENGHLVFAVIDGISNSARAVESDARVLSTGKVTSLAATFDVKTGDMLLYVDGAEVPSSLAANARVDIVQIRETKANVRIGAPLDDPRRAVRPGAMRGTVLESAYYGWSLPPSFVAALHESRWSTRATANGWISALVRSGADKYAK